MLAQLTALGESSDCVVNCKVLEFRFSLMVTQFLCAGLGLWPPTAAVQRNPLPLELFTALPLQLSHVSFQNYTKPFPGKGEHSGNQAGGCHWECWSFRAWQHWAVGQPSRGLQYPALGVCLGGQRAECPSCFLSQLQCGEWLEEGPEKHPRAHMKADLGRGCYTEAVKTNQAGEDWHVCAKGPGTKASTGVQEGHPGVLWVWEVCLEPWGAVRPSEVNIHIYLTGKALSCNLFVEQIHLGLVLLLLPIFCSAWGRAQNCSSKAGQGTTSSRSFWGRNAEALAHPWIQLFHWEGIIAPQPIIDKQSCRETLQIWFLHI